MLGDPAFLLTLVGMVAIMGAMAAVLLWTLHGDRQGHLRRCPSCWHDLAATPGLTCGECGFQAREEAQLHQNRRRPLLGLAGIAILLTLAGLLHWNSTVSKWTELLPDRVVVLMIPWSNGHDDLAIELLRRIRTAELGPAARAAALERCLGGDGSAPPGSEAWERRYAPMLLDMTRNAGPITPEERAALLDLPCRVDIEGPRLRLNGQPMTVHAEIAEWWPVGTECRLRIRPRDGSGREVVAVRSLDGRPVRLPIPVAALAEGASTLEIEVEVQRRTAAGRRRAESIVSGGVRWGAEISPESGTGDGAGDDSGGWEPAGEALLSLPLERCEPMEQVMQAVRTEEVRAVMDQVFSGAFHRSARGERRFGVRFNPSATALEPMRDLAIGLRVEVLEEGVPRRVSNLWWMGGPHDHPAATAYSWEILEEDAEALDRAEPGDPRWTLRITGDPALAARATAFARESASPPWRWFAETIEKPLLLQHREEVAPPRSWRVEAGAPGL